MSTPVLAQIVEGAVRRVLRGMYFSLPAQIVSYDAATQTCSVQISILGSDVIEGDRVPARDSLIENVPVVWTSGAGGDCSITMPLQPGDGVLLQFSSRSLARWLTRGGIDVNPGSTRNQHIKDAIAIVGLRAAPDKLPEEAMHDTDMVLRAPGIRLGSADADDPVVRRSDLQALIDELDLHTHPAPGGATGAPSAGGFTVPACSDVVRCP